MTVGDLIEKLSQMDKNKVVILTEPGGIGWDNVGLVLEESCQVKITMDGEGLFHE